ncbi:hypothetical protein GCM10009754_84750 [Amycolatopsis minnesotensis]|uniref:DUF4352 domain-containing protein n=1 Tax=Amycolatopsis minnesotensis TaxID=337894 RepID=A0ABN2SUE9_9PSEU
MFGSKRILATIGTVLCVLAIVFTLLAQNAAVKKLNELGAPAAGFEASSQTYAVGDTHRGTDIDITVAEPKGFTTGTYAMPKQNAKGVSYQVTVANHSAKPWPAAMLLIQATAGSTPAEQVFDTAGGFSGVPSQDVLSGKSLTFRIGFLDSPGDVAIEVGTAGEDKAHFAQKR